MQHLLPHSDFKLLANFLLVPNDRTDSVVFGKCLGGHGAALSKKGFSHEAEYPSNSRVNVVTKPRQRFQLRLVLCKYK